MFTGAILIIATGLLWMLVGAVFSKVNEKAVNFPAFMFFYSILFCGIIHLLQCPEPTSPQALMPIACCMLLSAILGQGGFLALFAAMKKTDHSIAWTFAQSAMIIPFLGGWLLLGNQVNGFNLCGIVILAAALFLLGKSQKTPNTAINSTSSGITLCLISLALTGLSQFLTLPAGNFCNNDPVLLAWRLPLFTYPGIVFWGIIWLCKKQKANWTTVAWSALYAIIVSVGQILLYMALDQMQLFNLSNIVYPVAISICIVTFAIFCRIFRHEKFNPAGICGLLLLMAAVIMLFKCD